jgi:type IV pilus assembly protein PilY1
MTRFNVLRCSAVLSAALIAFPAAGLAQAVITLPGGNVSLGVDALGALGAGSLPSGSNVPGGLYGIYYAPTKQDGIAPGCFCEGWGVAANGTAGYVGNDDGGTSNITGVSFASTSSTATSVTNLGGTSLHVTQAFSPSAANTTLFQDQVTLTNTGSTAMTNVEYTRSMDWDIPPTEFHEYVTIGGVPASALLFSNDDGFCVPDPLGSCSAILGGTTNTNFTTAGPADQGSFFTFGFGSLAAGGSTTFDIFYGAADNEADAFAALSTDSAEVYALGLASNGPGGAPNYNGATWAFGFSGVGGEALPPPPSTSPVPEPSSLLLVASGLLGGVATIRRRFGR